MGEASAVAVEETADDPNSCLRREGTGAADTPYPRPPEMDAKGKKRVPHIQIPRARLSNERSVQCCTQPAMRCGSTSRARRIARRRVGSLSSFNAGRRGAFCKINVIQTGLYRRVVRALIFEFECLFCRVSDKWLVKAIWLSWTSDFGFDI